MMCGGARALVCGARVGSASQGGCILFVVVTGARCCGFRWAGGISVRVLCPQISFVPIGYQGEAVYTGQVYVHACALVCVGPWVCARASSHARESMARAHADRYLCGRVAWAAVVHLGTYAHC